MRGREFRDLAISAIVLALAFGIALSGGLRSLLRPDGLLIVVGMATVGVSLGFLFHELGHRLLARRFGYFAEFKMWPAGLAVALGLSLFGFVFAAPGAVIIMTKATVWGMSSPDREKSGIISLAGPATNVGLAMVFLALDATEPALLFTLGASVNTWLAVFNLIPFGPLDGAKIFRWSRVTWAIAMAAAGGLFVAGRFSF